MLENSSSIPDFLTQGENALVALGFKAEARVHDGFGVGMTPLRSLSIQVLVDGNDSRFLWDVSNIDTTAYVAGVHAQKASVKSPRGFEFVHIASGQFVVSSRAASKAEADEFVNCFLEPAGNDGLIVGPSCISAEVRAHRARTAETKPAIRKLKM